MQKCALNLKSPFKWFIIHMIFTELIASSSDTWPPNGNKLNVFFLYLSNVFKINISLRRYELNLRALLSYSRQRYFSLRTMMGK